MTGTTLCKGQKLDSGFSILDIIELDELNARGIWARHDRCGVEVFHILNDDSENLFAFSFATAPEDDTGAAHILEHSVFCGSRNYPLKDAFLVLAQGSLQTFLNAWTFPDKTVYPASSVNEHDYFNLMSVYGDAVFRPLLTEWTFMQEGHRLYFENAGNDNSGDTRPAKNLSLTGVVYNEMKGSYSSFDTYAQHWSVKAIMPNTPYAFESGGDPQSIPELTWNGLKDFHRRRYLPANCKIFLAGNIDTQKQLAFLNEKFFFEMEGGEPAASIPRTERWNSSRNFCIPCPAGAEQKATAFISWLCSDVKQASENIALAALSEILLGHDGSPLIRALVESGIGEDISPVSGLDAELRETLFAVGLRGISGGTEEAGKKVEDLIFGELSRLVNEGINRQDIEAALLSMEFDKREIRRSGGPFSLVWMRLCLRGWLHGNKPWETLLFNPAMEKLKANLAENERYFESLIQKYLLDNPHRALVVMKPLNEFLPQQEAELKKKLRETEFGLSDMQRREIIEKSEMLEYFQNTEDSPDALACIPHLNRSDLSEEPELIPRQMMDISGIPCLGHELYTNGISYIDVAFPLDVLEPEDYLWLPFFSRAMSSSGLPGLDYGEVSGLLARITGGFYAMLHNGSLVPEAGTCIETPLGILDLRGRDWMVYRVKCLDEKTEAALDLVLRILTEADFTDDRHIRDLVLEMKSTLDSSLAPLGHRYASLFSNRLSSRAKMTDEIWSGLSQIEFVHRLAGYDTRQIIAKLQSLRKTLASGGVIANITGSAGAISTASGLLSRKFSSFGQPCSRKNRGITAENFSHELGAVYGNTSGADGKVFSSPSLQIGYCAASFRSAPFDTLAQAAEAVAAHQLSTGALWEEIRMKGGAYGAHASSDSLETCFSISTYRDPNPLRSVESFQQILKNLAEKQPAKPLNSTGDDDSFLKMIIGTYAHETQPRTSAEKGLVDFFRFLCGFTDDYRKRKLKRIISVSHTDVCNALNALASQTPGCPVIIAGTQTAEQAAKAWGTELCFLPV